MKTFNVDNNKIYEYVVVGAGPAAICAIPNIISTGVRDEDIAWIDPHFSVGDFGSKLSVGSSVPGNTRVMNYQHVIQAIYHMFPFFSPGKVFELDQLDSEFICPLKVAAQPLQHISNHLREMVFSFEGAVSNIDTEENSMRVEIISTNNEVISIKTKRVILATGASARKITLNTVENGIQFIDPTTAFIHSEFENLLIQNPSIKTVAVIGSSHSAALAVMHALKLGLNVKQFMNKEYLYATPAISSEGKKYTMYDNTGLKGDVAKFTKKFLEELDAGHSEFQNKFNRFVGKDTQHAMQLFEEHSFDCSHVVAAVGYQSSDTLKINGLPLSSYTHDNRSTKFKEVSGIFGIGIAFPQEVKAISGEVELAVGVGKFWDTTSDPLVLEMWKNG